MIYILEFFKGTSFALVFFGAFWCFVKFHSFFLFCLGLIPGLLLSLVFILLIENYELKEKSKI
ncbi:hypothetical protein OLO84_05055 [Campylobacter jejuni]|uniref:hypothetical protein n=1 Tax=Campylobacter jejuni TaxID=197 RepID=UPI001DD72062|nr:hypothetical protein [Campylobacter jejuni]ECP9271852.1 hypothetical protein [Campylobacter jejuni]MCW1316842.1 hypothetical protein [Campylobacter jejuni]MCW1320562.1 hypothetical protein [Campylobacter jejuni]HEC2815800.1 hypothetical protein [Campylobacter jejuni]